MRACKSSEIIRKMHRARILSTLYVAVFSFIAFTFVGKVFILRGLWVKATSCRVSSKVLPEVKAKGTVAFTRKRLFFKRLQRMVKE